MHESGITEEPGGTWRRKARKSFGGLTYKAFRSLSIPTNLPPRVPDRRSHAFLPLVMTLDRPDQSLVPDCPTAL
jgi:hypothetical protein